MKSSFTQTTATALRGFAGWIAGREGGAVSEVEHIPFVVSACGYRSSEPHVASDAARDRWLPGLSVDNFS